MELAPPNSRGKGEAVQELLSSVTLHQHDLLRGKSTTSATLPRGLQTARNLQSRSKLARIRSAEENQTKEAFLSTFWYCVI